MAWDPQIPAAQAWTRPGIQSLGWGKISDRILITYWDSNSTDWDKDPVTGEVGTIWDAELVLTDTWTKQ